MTSVSRVRLHELLTIARETEVLVVGDVMLDQFVWGRVSRISPEAPVPIVDFERESFMPGGAANVARNVTALGGRARMYGVVGKDPQADLIREILQEDSVDCGGLLVGAGRMTTTKTRIVAGQQQITRLDRETRSEIGADLRARLLRRLEKDIPRAHAVVIGDYGKGLVSQALLEEARRSCKIHGRWISLDPKPVHSLDLTGLSLLTPNRKEIFELAGVADTKRHRDPLEDTPLLTAVTAIQKQFRPALLLVTLGELGMLLCRRDVPPFHIPTVAREVFDVSGAGDTVIASFTLAIACGASPIEAAVISNHAAGVVVAKRGTAVVTPDELLATFPVNS